jgi:two-component system, NarL family, response regulator LiaR
MSNDVIRVMIVDDHPLAQSGLRNFLSGFPDLELVGEAHDGGEALGVYERVRHDVVLMDLLMPGMGGVAATQAIRARDRAARVLVVTSSYEADLIDQALKAGAVGYLLKNVSAFELAQAIRAAYAGRSAMSPEVVDAIVQRKHAEQQGIELSERERAVLQLLVIGRSNPQMAEELHLSRATIKYHLANIFAKLGVESRGEAIARAYELRLVTPGQSAGAAQP